MRNATYNGRRDAFVTKLHPSGSSIIYSTFLGGIDYDYGYGIVLDGTGNAYIAGYTQNSDYPVKNAYDATWNGWHDAFFTKLIYTSTVPVCSDFTICAIYTMIVSLLLIGAAWPLFRHQL